MAVSSNGPGAYQTGQTQPYDSNHDCGTPPLLLLLTVVRIPSCCPSLVKLNRTIQIMTAVLISIYCLSPVKLRPHMAAVPIIKNNAVYDPTHVPCTVRS
eukprot:884941-Rhodomonas_salina.2